MPFKNSILIYNLPLLPLFLVFYCGSDGGNSASRGMELYDSPHEDGNSYACASCHALEEPTSDGYTRPGHPIGDAASRPNYKNGQLNSLLDAVNTCRTEWMNAPAWANTDSDWSELESFLVDMAPETAGPITISQIVPPDDLSGGDAMAGQEVFNSTCIVCHGENGGGTKRAPSITGRQLETDYIARRVRTSGLEDSAVYPNLTGGKMPFWGADRLSDADLLDIVEYVSTSEAPTDNGGMNPGGGGPTRDCPSTHSKIGQSATLVEFAHDIAGTATIIDDCTIEITMFNFDGNGVNVQFYGGVNEQYNSGFSMSEDIRRSTPYVGETIYATLPEDKTLDDLDGISVWCVPVGASFGDGQFQ